MIGVVWNPTKTDRETLERAAREAGSDAQDLEWFEPEEGDFGQGAARRALDAGCEVVVTAGGDGTVRAIAAELLDTEIALGIVPLGTGNLLARNLSVPLGGERDAFARIFEDRVRVIDTAEARVTLPNGDTETHVFAVMAGFGIDAQMIAETDDSLKSRAGWLAYLESMGRAVQGSPVTEFDLVVDEGDASTDAAHTVLIGNCGSIQGGVTLMPDADPEDGLLDLLVLRADGIVSWLDTLHNMAWENGIMRLLTPGTKARSSKSAEHLQAEHLVLTPWAPVEFEVDGDTVGEVAEIAVRVRPGSLRVR